MADSEQSAHAYQEAHINENQKTEIIAPSVIFLAIAYTALLLRYKSRRVSRLKFEADDWCVGLSLVGKVLPIVVAKSLTPHMDDHMFRHHLLFVDEIRYG